MAVDVRRVLQDKPGSFIAYFIPLLVLAEENVELIDVVELFGLDRLAEAIERLGGSRVVFPTWATVDALVRDAHLVARLEALIDTPENRRALEEEFESDFRSLRARGRAVKDTLRKVGGPMPGDQRMRIWFNKLKKVRKEIEHAGRNGTAARPL
jgi:hypothetical protein